MLPASFQALTISSETNGFDILTPPSASEFSNYAAQYGFYAGYTAQMTSTDLGNALQAGLGVMLIQGYYSPMNNMTGSAWAQNAITDAENIGYLKGCILWLDFEDITMSASNAVTWANDWYNAVNSAGYVPGIYIGQPNPLDASQLDELLFQHFWKSCSTVPSSSRGFQIIQTCSSSIDTDLVQTDNDGGLPIAEYQINN